VNQKPETVDTLIDELPSRYVVGIDLGTTNSAVTWIDTSVSHLAKLNRSTRFRRSTINRLNRWTDPVW